MWYEPKESISLLLEMLSLNAISSFSYLFYGSLVLVYTMSKTILYAGKPGDPEQALTVLGSFYSSSNVSLSRSSSIFFHFRY